MPRPQASSRTPWWREAVIYQIYPRSFADSTGSGVGDLTGVRARLEYLEWLGVDALWLSPFFVSPMHDFGYDVSEYCDVDPLFGNLDDFDALLEAAHGRGLRVIIDWVPSHTSSEHPWFLEARASRQNPRRDWYVWRDPGPQGRPPNNWIAAFGKERPAWTLDGATGQYYLHSFLPEQPDLNWGNPDVVRAMHDTLRFWLRRGVDGIRADVIHNIGKDPALPDVEPALAKLPHAVLNDESVTHELLRGIRAVLDEFPGERMMVGEVFLLRTEQIAPYYGQGDELHLSFNFPPLFAPWQAERWRECVERTDSVLDPIEAWPTWVLSNHDQKRHRTRHASGASPGDARARAAAVLLLTLRGTPFLYMGEELGLEEAHIPGEQIVDPGGRDGCRAPLPWDATPSRGWGPTPWLPFPPESGTRNIEALRRDESSILHLYRRLLRARRSSPALRGGKLEWMSSRPGLLIYRRSTATDERVGVINFRAEPAELELEPGHSVEIASDGRGEGLAFPGEVGADQALLLQPGSRS